MKSKVTLSIDSAVVEQAKASGINISAAAEHGVLAELGAACTTKVQKDEHGNYIMSETTRVQLDKDYDNFKTYAESQKTRYDRQKALVWLYERSVRVGIDAKELLTIFESKYSQHLADIEKAHKLVVSEEALKDLEDIYFTSFCIFADNLFARFRANRDISDSQIVSLVESKSVDWVNVRRTHLGTITRKELYNKLRDRYNDLKGKNIL